MQSLQSVEKITQPDPESSSPYAAECFTVFVPQTLSP